jgi:hypothetical protein
MTHDSETDELRISISAQGDALSKLAKRSAEIKAKMEALCTQLGFLSQEYMILNEAMRVTLESLNGGIIPPVSTMRFPELSGYDHD